MHAKLEHYWLSLPALSGLLLVLSFHPFNLWPLGFIALAPLFYFVAGFSHSRTRIFWGGFLTGGFFAFCLSYFTLVQFHWLPEAYLFTGLVRLSVIPITVVGGLSTATLLLYWQFRSDSLLYNVLLAAAAYTLSELILQCVFGGYYLATLAYVAAGVPALMGLAAIGGAPLVSFVVAAASATLAELASRRHSARELSLLLVCAVIIAATLAAQSVYLRSGKATGEISVTILQQGVRQEGQFGAHHESGFDFPWLAEALEKAHSRVPDLVVYPFSPVEGALYRTSAPLNKEVLAASEKEFGAFVEKHLGSGTLLTWNSVYDGAFHNEYQVWRSGKIISEYQKRAPFPFMDYTPAWAQRIGLYSTPFDVAAGGDNTLSIDGIPLGALICSEVHSEALARTDARSAPLIIAAGSEAMFQDAVASSFSLKAAQFRAAENNIPVVRGNILGPSAIIAPTGGLIAYAPPGKEAAVSAFVPLSEARHTLYNRLGPLLPLLLICGILGTALWRRYSR